MNWTAKRDAFLAALHTRPLVMGILNATPDSFSDGGQHDSVEAALTRARQMVTEGCDVLDIGGESTRPGATPVELEEELQRVLPVVRALGGDETPVSIDTYKAATARAAVEAGAVIINDVWGAQKDPEMAAAMAETEAAVVLMHNRAEANVDVDVMEDMRAFLSKSLEIVTKAGVLRDRILLDPGIGFGKTPEQSLTCLNRLDDIADWFGLPVLLGLSRKRMIGHVLDVPVDRRLTGTLAANMIGLARGANVLRVHDVVEHVQATKMYTAVRTVP
ncbi:MAG: dihydropteroate synthase [Pseudomonadota bacterium]